MNVLAQTLKCRIGGEMRVDAMTRHLYSTDASMFQVQILGVIVPRHVADVVAAMELAAKFRVPVLPRGGGTALAGQAVGEALIFDFSTPFTRILELNMEEEWVRVQPGVVQDQLNAFLAPHGYLFGPDTATSNRATIGGMAGNNSSGKGSIVYGGGGAVVRGAEEVGGRQRCVAWGAVDAAGVATRQGGDGVGAQIDREGARMAEAHRDEEERRFPEILRRVSGYNLDEVLKSPTPKLDSLLVGSEGTLAVTTALKVKICRVPKAKALMAIHFDDLVGAVEGNELILTHGPSAMELFDRRILSEALAPPVLRGKTGFIAGSPEPLLQADVQREHRRGLGLCNEGEDVGSPLAGGDQPRQLGCGLDVAGLQEEDARQLRAQFPGVGQGAEPATQGFHRRAVVGLPRVRTGQIDVAAQMQWIAGQGAFVGGDGRP